MKTIMFVLSMMLAISCETTEHITQLVPGPKGKDGALGLTGATGPKGDAGIIVVNPCDTKSLFEEVLFITPSGVVAIFHNEDTGLSYLTVLPPGQYKTSDSTDCLYTVEPDITVTW